MLGLFLANGAFDANCKLSILSHVVVLFFIVNRKSSFIINQALFAEDMAALKDLRLLVIGIVVGHTYFASVGVFK